MNFHIQTILPWQQSPVTFTLWMAWRALGYRWLLTTKVIANWPNIFSTPPNQWAAMPLNRFTRVNCARQTYSFVYIFDKRIPGCFRENTRRSSCILLFSCASFLIPNKRFFNPVPWIGRENRSSFVSFMWLSTSVLHYHLLCFSTDSRWCMDAIFRTTGTR